MRREEAIDILNIFLRSSGKELEKEIFDALPKIDEKFFEVAEEVIFEREQKGDKQTASFLTIVVEDIANILRQVRAQQNDGYEEFVQKALAAYIKKGKDSLLDLLEDNLELITIHFYHDFQQNAVEYAINYGELDLGLELLDISKLFYIYLPENKEYLDAVADVKKVDILLHFSKYEDVKKILLHAADSFAEQKEVFEYAETLAQLAQLYDNLGESQDALLTINKAIKIFIIIKKSMDVTFNVFVQSYTLRGNIYFSLGELNKAEKNFLIAERICFLYEVDVQSKVSFLNNYALFLSSTGDYERAIYMFHYIYIASLKMQDNEKVFTALYNLADIYLLLGDFKKSKELLIEAVKINDHLNSEIELARCYQLLGIIEFEIAKKTNKSRKKALCSLLRAKEFLEQSQEQKLLGEVFFNIGKVIIEINPKKAQEYFNISGKYIKEYQYSNFLEYEKAFIAYFKGEISDAILKFKSLKATLNKNAKKEICEINIALGIIYKNLGDTQRSLFYYLESIKAYEKLSSNIIDSKAIFYIDKNNIYEETVKIALSLKENIKAYEILEISKARELKDLLEISKKRDTIAKDIYNLNKLDNLEDVFKIRRELNELNLQPAENITFDGIKVLL